jgi:hypothetical protein
MTAGNQPTLLAVNSTAGNLATQLRNAMQQIIQFNQWLTAYGGAAELESALGFTTTDANTIISSIANLATLAGIYQGTAQAGGAFNYMANSEALWGGQ